MPEMPEVETMVDRMQKYAGLTVQLAAVSEDSDRYLPGDDRQKVMRQKINGVFRRGKFMIFMLDHGALLCHNAMSGYWDSIDEPWTFDYVEGERASTSSDVRAGLLLSSPENMLLTAQSLRFHDARKFGSLKYFTPEDLAVKLSSLGPEMLESKHLYQPNTEVDEESFIDTFQKVKLPIKVAMMDQKRIAGIGNIYAVEACWAARIDPRKPGRELNENQLSQLYHSSQAVLQAALDRNLDYKNLNIYRKKICPVCHIAVTVIDLKGRSTYLCESCQK